VEDDSLVEALSTTPSVQRSLGAADYTIHRPPDGTTWRSTTAQQRPPTDIEIDDPPSTQPNVRLTATEFRDYVYNMRHDRASKPTNPGSNDAYDTKDSDTKESTQALDPTVIGDIVHKLCELRLPQAEWPDIIRRLAPDPTVITDEIITQIEEHVNTGLAELEQIQSAHPVEQRFDELQVTARFSAGRIIGDIDHLSVTPTGYHVVDYKTSGLTGRSTETLREYYLPQLRVYACALYQADPSLDSVDLRLVFTDEGETESINLEPADIEADLDRYETILQQY
jgi:ATP-dependent helicase/nuclease subunit A